ncbi:MAG: hypothetical protein FJ295_19285 [Planctomycetes bacterium]|nr:hypothetical protein [Planctomycetota bacterium]
MSRWSRTIFPARTARRSGYTLAEMVAVMFLFSMMLPIAVGVIQKSWRVQTESHQAYYFANIEQRLADRFRVDVHASEQVEFGETGIALMMPDGAKIRYMLSGDRIERRVEGADRPLHRETFPLGVRRRASFEECGQDAIVRIRLQIADFVAPDVIQLRVEAVLGLITRGGDR